MELTITTRVFDQLQIDVVNLRHVFHFVHKQHSKSIVPKRKANFFDVTILSSYLSFPIQVDFARAILPTGVWVAANICEVISSFVLLLKSLLDPTDEAGDLEKLF